jgi:hypothetical protein
VSQQHESECSFAEERVCEAFRGCFGFHCGSGLGRLAGGALICQGRLLGVLAAGRKQGAGLCSPVGSCRRCVPLSRALDIAAASCECKRLLSEYLCALVTENSGLSQHLGAHSVLPFVLWLRRRLRLPHRPRLLLLLLHTSRGRHSKRPGSAATGADRPLLVTPVRACVSARGTTRLASIMMLRASGDANNGPHARWLKWQLGSRESLI